MKKLAVCLFVLSAFIFVSGVLAADNITITGDTINGKATFGTFNLIVQVLNSVPPIINILSPLNISYNFLPTDNITLDLNVSANQAIASWWFTLENLNNNSIVYSNVTFFPNITFTPVRKSNRITVYANNTQGDVGSANVTFYVNVSNSAPVLGNMSKDLYVCEGAALSYWFNATDADADDLQVSIDPLGPFFVYPTDFTGQAFIRSELFSGILAKNRVGKYSPTVSVSDGQYSDAKNVNITVIEINNPPVINPIGVQTIYTRGANRTFTKQVDVHDIESGDANSGKLSFNLTFINSPKLFDISKNGTISITGNDSIVGVYNISVCVTDQALSSISPNISLCGQNGLNMTSCSNFSLTVTNDNRPPVITSFYPNTTLLNALGTQNIHFNISTYDADGTIPDIYIYVNNASREYISGNSTASFNVAFGCGIGGLQVVKAEITDGLANDSVSWNISLSNSPCPVPESSGGAGGGGGGGCAVKWACNVWQTCQNTANSLRLGAITGEQYRQVKSDCDALKLNDTDCGMQIRSCFDANACNTTVAMPELAQACHYSENPSCYDKINNCHDGSCELLVDCGGPCSPCASCSDGIQNQGELGVDCGGPCPNKCFAESPLGVFDKISSSLLIWLIILLLLILLIWLNYKAIGEWIKVKYRQKTPRETDNSADLTVPTGRKEIRKLAKKLNQLEYSHKTGFVDDEDYKRLKTSLIKKMRWLTGN